MIAVHEFTRRLASELPDTWELCRTANLVVHERVARITLHGSRGPAGGYRPDSDIDLCLVVDVEEVDEASLGTLLREVLDTTLRHWRGPVEPDLAAVFDKSGCGLVCFEGARFEDLSCQSADGCLGVFKIQKGFDGFVAGPAVQVPRMYPYTTIWRRDGP